MQGNNRLVYPPLTLFLSHFLLFFISGVTYLIFLDNLLISFMFIVISFSVLLIFLTLDKTMSKSRNYSKKWTSNISKLLLIFYLAFGALISYQLGFDFAYENFLKGFIN